MTLGVLSVNSLAANEIAPLETDTGSGCANLLQMKGTPFYSQTSQDEFVFSILYGVLNKQDQGYFLDIGAGHPTGINNTYFFEKNFQWKGTSMDVVAEYASAWSSSRNNLFLLEDATAANFDKILEDFPETIDYLSLDTDGNYTTILRRLPWDKHIFKVMTIEHDFYRFGPAHRAEEREFLNSQGYYLLCPDMSNDGNSFEDWWIHPSAFPPEVLANLLILDLASREHKDLVKIFQSVACSSSQN
jgi:hypothetical protein